jgi:flagellar FliL protein
MLTRPRGMTAMSDDAPKPAKAKGSGFKGILIGLLLALPLGGGSFFAVYSGMIALPLPDRHAMAAEEEAAMPLDLPQTAFLPLEQVVVTLGRGTDLRQLALTAQLEVEPNAIDTVALLMPRVVDVMSTYLRAVDVSLVEDPASMLRLRAQMLRRIQVVTGEGMVRDLLVSEFIVR